jgi:hypothetical protein
VKHSTYGVVSIGSTLTRDWRDLSVTHARQQDEHASCGPLVRRYPKSALGPTTEVHFPRCSIWLLRRSGKA